MQRTTCDVCLAPCERAYTVMLFHRGRGRNRLDLCRVCFEMLSGDELLSALREAYAGRAEVEARRFLEAGDAPEA